ncbi:schlafen family member 13-like isoform X2 [Babylonia areolata]
MTQSTSKHMLSSKFIVDHLSQYGEVVLECPVYISRGIHDKQNQQVLQYACALLNSGGGLLHMHNVEHARKVQSKDLDTWWSGMESNLADILSGDDLCSYFDFVGNFDDPNFFLFVKTAEHICTLNYHCRLPTDTATHNVTYASVAKLLSKTGEPSPLGELPPVLTEYRYRQVEDTLKQEGKQIQFKLLATTKDQAKTFADRIRHYCVKYITAFANHYGGHVYFGIEDATAAVLGEALEAGMEYKITQQVQKMMKDLIWGDTNVKAERGKHWDIQFYPVTSCPRMERRRVVVVSVCKFPGGVFTACPESYVVRQGGQVEQLDFPEWKDEVLNQARVRPDLQTRFVKVPLHTPFSHLVYTLPHTLQAAKEKVLKLSTGFNLQPGQYLDLLTDQHLATCLCRLLSTFADDPHLALPLQCWGTRFDIPGHEDLCLTLLILSQVYGVHLVLMATSYLNSGELWTLGRQLSRQVKHRLVTHGGCTHRLVVHVHVLSVADPLMVENFQASIDSSIYPPTYMLNTPKMDDILTSLVIAIASYAPCQETGVSKRELMSWEKDCHFLLTCDQLQLLWTRQFTKELWVHGPPGAGKTVAALHMIQELVARGCDRPQVLYLAENPLLCTYIRSFTLCKVASRRELLEDRATPGRFLAKYRQVKNVIVDEAQNFKDRDGDWYSLAEQLACLGAEHIVQSDQGSDMLTSTSQGQTSKATLQQCAVDGVSTKDFHGSMTVTPCGDASPAGTNIEDDRSSEQAYKHQVSPPKRPRSSKTELTSGYFWVFMDYAQKVHKFKAGLPGLIGKNNFMLSEISRNSKEIFDYAMKFMSKPSDAVQQGRGWVEDAPVLGHDYQNGQGVEVVRCNKDSVHRTLFSVLESYLGNGMKPDDIAILVSKSKEKEAVEKFVKQDLLQKDSEDSDQTGQSSCDVTVDTVRRFSGLDKPVVIGVEPHADTDHADLDKFIVNLATRAKDGLVIITTSDHLMRKLQIQ